MTLWWTRLAALPIGREMTGPRVDDDWGRLQQTIIEGDDGRRRSRVMIADDDGGKDDGVMRTTDRWRASCNVCPIGPRRTHPFCRIALHPFLSACIVVSLIPKFYSRASVSTTLIDAHTLRQLGHVLYIFSTTNRFSIIYSAYVGCS